MAANRHKHKRAEERRVGNRNILFFISIVYFIFMIIVSLLRDNGYMKVWAMDKELNELRYTISLVEKNNRRLESEIIALRTDNLSYIEKVAREELGLVKRGEVVYEFISGEINKGMQNKQVLSKNMQ